MKSNGPREGHGLHPSVHGTSIPDLTSIENTFLPSKRRKISHGFTCRLMTVRMDVMGRRVRNIEMGPREFRYGHLDIDILHFVLVYIYSLSKVLSRVVLTPSCSPGAGASSSSFSTFLPHFNTRNKRSLPVGLLDTKPSKFPCHIGSFEYIAS